MPRPSTTRSLRGNSVPRALFEILENRQLLSASQVLAPAGTVTSWNSTADYSGTKNPSGAWEYGDKSAVTGTAFTLMTVSWAGGTAGGWYLGNVGDGSPSIAGGSGVVEGWSRSNANGLATVRWICPATGFYDLSSKFIGEDSRGVDNNVYVVVNGKTAFTGSIVKYLGTSSYAPATLSLTQGEPIDFSIQWAGGVNEQYGWTDISAIINKVTPSIVVTAPANQSAVEGQSSSVALGSFSESNATGPFKLDVGWGDGTPDTILSLNAPGAIPAIGHNFAKTGLLKITERITDSRGISSNQAVFNESVTAPSGAIVGTVFNDTNADGKLGSGESGLAKITVFIDSNKDGILDNRAQSLSLTSSALVRLRDLDRSAT